jgi:hypothetical protein
VYDTLLIITNQANMRSTKKLTSETFIIKAQQIHGNLFDYSKIDYKGSKKNILIGCKIHGFFKQPATCHLQGNGCKQCGHNTLNNNLTKRRLTTTIFIERANKIHSNKYDYSSVNYKNVRTEIDINCIACNKKFTQLPKSHLAGKGCPICARSKKVKYKQRKPIAKPINGYIYLIKLTDEYEEFFKIGVTKHSNINRRYPRKRIAGYLITLISMIPNTYKNVIFKEKQLIKDEQYLKYTPKRQFGGWTECFKTSPYGNENLCFLT